MKRFALQFGLFSLVALARHATASTIGLNDWCLNLNGDIATACNGAGMGGVSPGGGSINVGSFDRTLESTAVNILGIVTVNLLPGLNQYVNFYADYDVDYSTFGGFDDFGSRVGTRPVGFSYELDDPNTSNVFSDFQNNALANSNNVGTPAGPPNNCCDVSFALGVGGLNVLAGGTGTVTFTIGKTAPASGFYLVQTNQDTRTDSIYLQATATINNPTTGTPEPSTFGLALGGVICFGAVWKRKRALPNTNRNQGVR